MSDRRPSVIFVSPIRPEVRGSGLALRARRWCEALAQTHALTVIVVPVTDPTALSRPDEHVEREVGLAWQQTVVGLPNDDALRAGAIRAMIDPGLRSLMADVEVPWSQRAPAWFGVDVADQLHPDADVVVCFRSYLIPFVSGLLSRLARRPALIVDVDDDDAALQRQRGDLALAAAFDRMLASAAPHVTEWVSAGTVAGLPSVSLVDNAVRIPPAPRRGAGTSNVLVVGNMTYPPNADGVRRFVAGVWPQVLSRAPHATLHVVGNGSVELLAGLGPSRAVAHGLVDHVDAIYEQADVVVAPIWQGSGSRIKIIEAWAFGHAVVTTPVGVSGLSDSADHVVVENSDGAFASAVIELLADVAGRRRIADAARRHAEAHHSAVQFAASTQALVERVRQQAATDQR